MIKKYIFYILFLLSINSMRAQNLCKRVDIIKSSPEKKVMHELIKEWKEKKYLVGDKGVISLYNYEKRNGETKLWYLSPHLDSRYGGKVSNEYSVFENYIILITYVNQEGKILPINESVVERDNINLCLSEIIGKKVISYVPPTPVFVKIKMSDGSTKTIEQRKDTTGNKGAQYFIHFYKNNKYKIVPSA